MSSLMIEDAIGELKEVNRNGVIIGGNFVNWYGGFDSYMVAQEITDIIYAPSHGKKTTRRRRISYSFTLYELETMDSQTK